MNVILLENFIYFLIYEIESYPKSSGHELWRHVLTSDDINFKEFPSKNGRAFPTFWQMTCPNHIFIGFYAEDQKSQQNFESITSLHYKCVTAIMGLGNG